MEIRIIKTGFRKLLLKDARNSTYLFRKVKNWPTFHFYRSESNGNRLRT